MLGTYDNLSNEDYHNDQESISRSGIMDYRESPYHYWANHLNPDRPMKEQTPAMAFGSAYHMFIMEPNLFDDSYIVEPLPMLLKDVGREMYDQYKARLLEIQNSNKISINQTIMGTILSMSFALRKHPQAMELINGAIYERSYFWKDEHSGLIVKARPDALHQNMIVDLKTISKASPHVFQRSMVDGGYHIQGAMQIDGVAACEGRKIENFICIAQEKTYPYSIGIYPISETALEVGHCEYKQALLDLKNDIGNNNWRGYEAQTIDLPTWYQK